MGWSVLLVSVFFSFAVAEDLLTAPKNCKETCITKFDGAEEDACSRGCTFSNMHLSSQMPTCEQSCSDTYKLDVKLVTACKVGCETNGQSSINIGVLPFPSFFGAFFDRIRQLLGGVTDGPGTSVETKTDSVDSATDPDSGNRVIISRVRIFHNIVPIDTQENPFESPFNMKPFFNLQDIIPQNNDAYYKNPRRDEKNIIRFRAIHNEDESSYQEGQPTTAARVTYFFRHIMFRPLLLPLLIALLLVILLLMVKLTIHACRLREHRHIEYTRLPTYIEAVNVKVPLYDDGMKTEKSYEKAPIDA
ncbi:unnamed protein product [Trichobilharzia szidati]|nr:unnamed protein product [Trichobilharzia szidati]CAH8849181.1 unnamed protein product [Trichobilharzia szidati]